MSRVSIEKSNNTTTSALSALLLPRVWVSFLSLLVLCFLVLYMYFLSMSVVHVVLRKEAQQSIATLETEIAALEATYIEAKHAVSERIASAENLTETSDKIFLTRAEPTVALSRP